MCVDEERRGESKRSTTHFIIKVIGYRKLYGKIEK